MLYHNTAKSLFLTLAHAGKAMSLNMGYYKNGILIATKPDLLSSDTLPYISSQRCSLWYFSIIARYIYICLAKLNRDQLRWVAGLFTEHCHLKGYLFKLGLTDSPICERWLEDDESATHILHDCEAIAHLRFCHLGQFFMKPS
jgi:hypothetical protein